METLKVEQRGCVFVDGKETTIIRSTSNGTGLAIICLRLYVGG